MINSYLSKSKCYCYFSLRMSEVFKRNKKHNKRQSASSSRKKGNQDEINEIQTMASSSSSSNTTLAPNSAQAITLHEFFISKGKIFIIISLQIFLLLEHL